MKTSQIWSNTVGKAAVESWFSDYLHIKKGIGFVEWGEKTKETVATTQSNL